MSTRERSSAIAGLVSDLGDAGAEAAAFLVGRGFYGVVWLDTDLVVAERTGSLVSFVEVGKPIGLAVPHLYGLDDDINALRHAPESSIELLNLALIGPGWDLPRLNFYLHWVPSCERFLVIVARTTTQAEQEAELESIARRAHAAEKEVARQARELERTNAELTRANRELAEFAYVISHDLRSPMRGIRYHAEDLGQALDSGDREAAARLLEGVTAQTRRMSQMLTDLLAYARTGRAEEAIEEIDARERIQAIVRSLPRSPAFRVEIEGDWPRIETVAAALDVVLRNLIDNAIKHHDRPDGRVAVSARSPFSGVSDGLLEITVADDGPGIPREHQEAVFKPFQKIERPSAGVEGSGIGLSLVRKQAEVSGAALELVSDPAVRRGTTFVLRWPARIVAQ